MATVLDLAMKVSADASSVPESLTKAERALLSLGKQADATAALFDAFSATTEGAGKAADSVKAQFDALAKALEDKAIKPKEYAEAFAALTQSAIDLANVFEQGAATTAKYRTESERASIELEKLNKQKQAGAISDEIYQRAVADVTGATKRATEAEAERAATMQRLASEGAAITQKYITDTERRAATLADLKEKVDAGLISEEIYQRAVADASGVLKAAEDSERARQRVMDDGRRITEQYATAEEKREAEMARLTSLRRENAISEETYQRALAEVSGENERAAAAERDRQRFLERAAQLTQNVVTPMQQYDAAVLELNTHLQAQTITQEVYDANLAKATQQFIKAESAAQGYDQAVASAGKGGTLAFNELSGILAAIPGPIGNIAGRMSGLSSAVEGLSRLFSSGLSGAISGVTGAIGLLANPIGLAVAAIAALSAGAVAVVAGLQSLSGRVEELSNLANRLGTSFQFAQVLEEAAKRSGVAVETLSAGLQRFAVNVAKARDEGGAAAEAFDRLGISQEELKNTDPTTLAGRVADALKGIKDPADRARIATELLGKSGLELLPAFASVDDATKSMDKFRTTISEIDVSRLSSLDDVFDNIGVALQGLGTQLLVPFTGLVDGVVTALTEVISGITRFIDPILDSLTPIFDGLGRLLATSASSFADFAELVGNAIGRVIEIATRIATIVGTAIQRFAEFTGLGSVVSGFASAVGSAFSGLWDVIKGVVSTIGGFIENVLYFAEEWLGIGKSIEEPLVVNIDSSSIGAAENVSQDFEKTLADVNQQLDKGKNEAMQFGQAGFDAAVQYEEGLKRAKEQLEDGILNETSYKKAVEDVTKSFNQQLDTIKQAADEATKRAEAEKAAAAKIIEDNKKIADSLLEQLRIEEEFGGDSKRAKAAENVLALEKEIERVEQAVVDARNAGDQKAINANVARLAKLDQVMAKEKNIASGIEAENKRLADEKKKLDDAREKALLDAAKAINEAELKYSKERFDIEKQRIEELNRLRTGALDIGDVRSGGADLFMDLLGKKEDAAIAEYRKQTDELKALREDLRRAQAKKVEILKGVA